MPLLVPVLGEGLWADVAFKHSLPVVYVQNVDYG